MASAYSYDLSTVTENFSGLFLNMNGGAMSPPRPNYGICPMCANAMTCEKILPCSHSVCGSCFSAHLWNSILVCPICRYSNIVEQTLSEYAGLNDPSRIEKVVYDILQARESPRNFSGNSTSSSSQNSSPTIPLSPLEISNGSPVIKGNEIVPSSGAIPKIRQHAMQPAPAPAPAPALMLPSQFRERQIPSNNVILNELLLNETLMNNVKVPPLSPIVGGETRSPRMLMNYRANGVSPPLQNGVRYIDNRVDSNDIPSCYHGIGVVEYYCTGCKITFCAECRFNHKNHKHVILCDANDTLRSLLESMLKETKNRENDVENGFCRTKSVLEELEVNYVEAEKEIINSSKKIMEAVEERKNTLLENLKRIRNAKTEILVKQMNTLRNTKYHLAMMARELFSRLDSNETKDLISLHISGSDNMTKIEHVALQLNPHEEATLTFNVQMNDVIHYVSDIGNFHSGASANFTRVSGVCTESAVANLPSHFIVRCSDHLGNRRKSGGDNVQAFMTFPSGKKVTVPIKDFKNGEYTGMYVSQERGEHSLFITLRGLPISNCLQKPIVRHRRTYRDIKCPPIEKFGTGPTGDTSLCRGWGIHCDIEGIIYVTERNNHAVLVFGPDLKFLRRFGRYGDREGEMNRPAGITVDVTRRLVVVDKDNHRVQFFTPEGEYLGKFGKRGTEAGEFQYPWDVDTNSKGQIVVSDSRNHRVQLFDRNGIILLSSENTLGKACLNIMEIPRGVCFDQQGNILVADFNNHHILVLSPHLRYISTIGRYSGGNGLFFRPQGVFVDPRGYIFVLESRSQRAQVFTPNRRSYGRILGFDRKHPFTPCDATMSPDGYIYMVNLENGTLFKL